MVRKAALLLGAGLLTLAASPCAAEITRVTIESREPLPGTFGNAGAYEVIRGHLYGDLDPADPHNAIITDLTSAPRNAAGRVDYSATYALTRPVDMTKASGILIYDVPNRSLTLPLTGDPDGHVHLVSGWQGDMDPGPGRQTLSVPVARNPDGSPITGPVLQRFIDMPAGATTLPIQGGLAGVLTWARPA
ncbi:MAG: hypothetical protein EBR82_06230, partial [Caulobacteraceae bacterium]|nr:hypothetical protein [Caulobacteraceae bacterium]